MTRFMNSQPRQSIPTLPITRNPKTPVPLRLCGGPSSLPAPQSPSHELYLRWSDELQQIGGGGEDSGADKASGYQYQYGTEGRLADLRREAGQRRQHGPG